MPAVFAFSICLQHFKIGSVGSNGAYRGPTVHACLFTKSFLIVSFNLGHFLLLLLFMMWKRSMYVIDWLIDVGELAAGAWRAGVDGGRPRLQLRPQDGGRRTGKNRIFCEFINFISRIFPPWWWTLLTIKI